MNETNGQANFSDAELRHYLLKSVEDGRREAIELELLANEVFFGRVEAAEEDLIDDYATERLSPADRELFEKNFLLTERRRENLKNALALRRYADANQPHLVLAEKKSQKPARAGFWNLLPRPAFVFAAVCLIGFGGWLFWSLTRHNVNNEPQTAKREATSASSPELKPSADVQPEVIAPPAPAANLNSRTESREVLAQNGNRANEKTKPQPTRVLALVLSSGIMRDGSGEIPRLTLPKNSVARVNLTLNLEPTGARNFRAELLTTEGKSLLTRSLSAKPGSGRISFSVPAEILQPGDYQIRLTGDGEAAGRFYFRVVK